MSHTVSHRPRGRVVAAGPDHLAVVKAVASVRLVTASDSCVLDPETDHGVLGHYSCDFLNLHYVHVTVDFPKCSKVGKEDNECQQPSTAEPLR